LLPCSDVVVGVGGGAGVLKARHLALESVVGGTKPADGIFRGLKGPLECLVFSKEGCEARMVRVGGVGGIQSLAEGNGEMLQRADVGASANDDEECDQRIDLGGKRHYGVVLVEREMV
jgi:hypothetical protein